MKHTLSHLKKDFQNQKEILESARITLKNEFVGIDKPIDDIIYNINSWFVLSSIQDRPFIINLWGLTGVGKTSLLNRLVELIDYESHYYRFDLGHKKGKHCLQVGVNDLCEEKIQKPVIIALDEFQHARTIEGLQKTEKEDKNRVMWDLIDSGKIQHQIYNYGAWRMRDNAAVLSRLILAGVVVENGKVIQGLEICKGEFRLFDEEKKLFIPEESYKDILELAGEELNLKLKSEVKSILLNMNGKESIQFLKKVVSISSKPVERDFSKSLIFIMGNLDEAYTMSGNYSADISADEFYKASLKISISKIKKALQTRFRHEQIARLGNIHVIYPALSKLAYRGIIIKETKLIQQKIYDLTQVKFNFHATVIDLIYNEGVYPTQGVRPVLTTVNYLIRNKITSFLSVILNKNISVSEVDIYFIDGCFLKCEYKQKNKIIHKEKIEISAELKKYNINKKDDLQCITAVHESGHAILCAVLLKTVPKYVYSKTVEDGINGFVYSEFKWKYISQKEIILRVAIFLGGMAAEEIIFGKENVTTGCSSDLKEATNFVMRMLKKEGLGKSKLSYQPKSIQTNLFFHTSKKVEKEADIIINQAYILAIETLEKERKLLIELSNYLSDHTYIKQKELEILIDEFVSEKVQYVKNGNNLFYRNHLKNLHLSICEPSEIHQVETVCLNKE